MGIPERNRDALPKKMTEVTNEQILEAVNEMKKFQTQLADHIDVLQSNERVQTDKVIKLGEEYTEILGRLALSEAERAKANEALAATNKELKAATSEVANMVNNHKKNMDAFLAERERKLDEAINEAKRLRPDMQEGFGRLIQQSTPSVKQKISQHIRQAAIIASSSVAGGVVVFLLCLWIFHGSFHTSTEKSLTPAATTTTTHHTASKKTK